MTATGQLLTGSFMDYAMPRADDFCAFDISPIRSRPRPTRWASRASGEAGTVGALAAVMNAINDAVAPLGITHLEMPATPAKIWQAIQEAKSAA